MNAELFVHGVPLGAKQWKEEDKEYYSTFYVPCEDKIKFFIQVRVSNGTPYCYYNYLVYDGVLGNDGRVGSYFGLTLRLDVYYKDILSIYDILNLCFNRFIKGDILEVKNGMLKYSISDFSSISNKLKGVEKSVGSMLEQVYNGEEEKLTGFAIGGNSLSYYLYDCTLENVRSIIHKQGCIAISPYYQSNALKRAAQRYEQEIQRKENECKERIHTAERQYKSETDLAKKDFEEKIRAKDDVYSKLGKENSRLQNELIGKNDEIYHLNSKVSRLEAETKRAGQMRELSEIVEEIKPLNEKLVSLLSKMSPEESKPIDPPIVTPRSPRIPKGGPKRLKPLLIIGTAILLISIILTCSNGNSKTSNENNEEETEAQISGADADSANCDDMGYPDNLYDLYDLKDIIIDLPNYCGGTLVMGQKYAVKAKKGVDVGCWKGVGCEIEKEGDPNKIKITPTSKNVQIAYYVGDMIVTFRNLKAE